MTISRLGILILSMAAAAAACSSAPPPMPHDSGTHDSGTHDSGTPPASQADSGFDAQIDAPSSPPACGAIAPAGEVPSSHRPVPTTCQPSLVWPGGPDPTLIGCTTSADCIVDGGSGLFTCLNGHCSNDQCLTDADCGATGACACARSTIQHNFCIPANCHADSDCGPGGYCSISADSCGSGVFCHTPKDSCVDPAIDCASCGIAAPGCVYAPGTGTFVCGSSACVVSG